MRISPRSAAARHAAGMPASREFIIQVIAIAVIVAAYFLLDRLLPQQPYVRTAVVIVLAAIVAAYYVYRARYTRIARLQAAFGTNAGDGNNLQAAITAGEGGVPTAVIVGHASTLTPADQQRNTIVQGIPVAAIASPRIGMPARASAASMSSASSSVTSTTSPQLTLPALVSAMSAADDEASLMLAMDALATWAATRMTEERMSAMQSVATAAQQKRVSAPQLWSTAVAERYGHLMYTLHSGGGARGL